MTTENLILSYGSHTSRKDGMCLMEAVAFMAGESHSDSPECACPILAEYARTLNDRMGLGPEGDALRAKYLLPIATKLVGTRSTSGVEHKRAFFFADRAVRLFAPKRLEAAGLTEEAKTLRALHEIVDERTARAAADAADLAADAGWAAHAVARAAAWATAEAAADAAAGAADLAADAGWAAHAAAAAAAWAARAAWAADAAAGAADAARTDAAAGAARAAAAAWAARAAWAAARNYPDWEQAAKVLAEACEIGLNRVS